MSLDGEQNKQNDTTSRSSSWRIARRNLIAGAGAFGAALLAAGRSASAQSEGARKKKPPRGHCFLAGTPILTPGGEVDVSTLRPGDLVVTQSGAAKPIVGVGRRTVVCGTDGVEIGDDRPVCIKRAALDAATPSRDLYVSRGHSLLIGGMLVSAESLINGLSIVEADMSERSTFDYFHIELAEHDVVIAAGVAAETLLVKAQGYRGFDTYETAAAAGVAAGATRPYAPLVGYNGRRALLKSRLRSALSPIVDRRTPLDKLRDRIEERAA